MKPVFVRINRAIEFTTDFFLKGQTCEYLLDYTREAKGNSLSSYKVQHWEDLLYNLHEQMEDEILQTVNTTNQNTQVFMFEYLREWLTIDWRFNPEPNFDHFFNLAVEHNDKINEEVEKKLEIAVKEFQSTEHFQKYGANEEYNHIVNYGGFIHLSSGKNFIPYTEKRINRKFYCNELSTSEFIDYFQINRYIALVKKIVLNFRLKTEKHLLLFDNGKYVPANSILPTNQQKELPAPPKKVETVQPQKLKVEMTVEQLAVFFRLLKEAKLIDPKVKDTQLADFITYHFETTNTEKRAISTKNLAKLFSSKEPDIVNFWIAKLKLLSEKAENK